jgi:hypothetical protein
MELQLTIDVIPIAETMTYLVFMTMTLSKEVVCDYGRLLASMNEKVNSILIF